MLSLKSRYPERVPSVQAQTWKWRRVKVADGVCLTEVVASCAVCDPCAPVIQIMSCTLSLRSAVAFPLPDGCLSPGCPSIEALL